MICHCQFHRCPQHCPDCARGDDADNGIFLPQVRKNPESNFNKRSRFVFLEDCAPWNILLLPHDPSDPACEVFDLLTGREDLKEVVLP